MGEKGFHITNPATSVPATARWGIFAARPERADEGGGPPPGDLKNDVLRIDS
jgi:hypothetical protein